MRIALFHNRYVFRGGEDRVVELEVELLRKAGHEVHLFQVDNREIRGVGGSLRAGLAARWNRKMEARAGAFLDAHPVDVGHVHNSFPLLSPAVHQALASRRIPVVQTLHNYRLFCANAAFLRNGAPCEECVQRGPWHAVRHACFRGSRLQTAAWARATAHHRARGVWHRLVDRFVAPSDFLRRKLVAAGLPAERFVVKPNAVEDPGPPRFGGRGAVFVGRLSPEKGVGLLLEAWRGLGGHPLTVVGTGPDEAELRRRGAEVPGVRFTGELDAEGVRSELARAAFVVAPSLWYENFPLSVAEALAAGRPVVASHPTALSDMIEPGLTGLPFAMGDAEALAQACRTLASDSDRCERMGREARAHYEDDLTPARCLERLEAIYADLGRPG